MKRGAALYTAYAREIATPEAAVLPLHEQLVRSVLIAWQAISDKDFPLAHGHLLAAQEVLLVLAKNAEADRSFAGSENLAGLYEWCRDELVAANLQKDAAQLAPVVEVLSGVRDAFVEGLQAHTAGGR